MMTSGCSPIWKMSQFFVTFISKSHQMRSVLPKKELRYSNLVVRFTGGCSIAIIFYNCFPLGNVKYWKGNVSPQLYTLYHSIYSNILYWSWRAAWDKCYSNIRKFSQLMANLCFGSLRWRREPCFVTVITTVVAQLNSCSDISQIRTFSLLLVIFLNDCGWRWYLLYCRQEIPIILNSVEQGLHTGNESYDTYNILKIKFFLI